MYCKKISLWNSIVKLFYKVIAKIFCGKYFLMNIYRIILFNYISNKKKIIRHFYGKIISQRVCSKIIKKYLLKFN